MSPNKTARRQKYVIFGLLVTLCFSLVGFGIAQAAFSPPSQIATCTSTKTGKVKVVTPPATCKKNTVGQTFDNDVNVAAQETALKAQAAAQKAALKAAADSEICSLLNSAVNDSNLLNDIVNDPTVLNEVISLDSEHNCGI
jgi:hypothetical protein